MPSGEPTDVLGIPESRVALTGWTRRDSLVAGGLALISGAAYVRTLAPGVVAGNSAEYQYVAPILGIAHSTGYPLYTLLGKAFTLLPIGSVAYRMNLLSAVAAAVAVATVYALVLRLTGRRMLGVAAALAFAFAASFWSAALIAEVHTLNVAFIALDVVLLLRWSTRQGTLPRSEVAWPELRLFALMYGLSLAHHRMALLLAPAFAVYIVLVLTAPRRSPITTIFHHGGTQSGEPLGPAEDTESGPQKARNRPQGTKQSVFRGWVAPLVVTIVMFLLPLALYAYIPIRGGQLLSTSDPAVTAIYKDRMPEAILRGTVTANYRGGWAGFVSLVSGSDYAVDVGLDSWSQLSERLVLWGETLITQYSVLGLLLGPARRDRPVASRLADRPAVRVGLPESGRLCRWYTWATARSGTTSCPRTSFWQASSGWPPIASGYCSKIAGPAKRRSLSSTRT